MNWAQQALEKISVPYKAQFLHSAKTLENPTLQNWAEIRVFSQAIQDREMKSQKKFTFYMQGSTEKLGLRKGQKCPKENIVTEKYRYW